MKARKLLIIKRLKLSKTVDLNDRDFIVHAVYKNCY